MIEPDEHMCVAEWAPTLSAVQTAQLGKWDTFQRCQCHLGGHSTLGVMIRCPGAESWHGLREQRSSSSRGAGGCEVERAACSGRPQDRPWAGGSHLCHAQLFDSRQTVQALASVSSYAKLEGLLKPAACPALCDHKGKFRTSLPFPASNMVLVTSSSRGNHSCTCGVYVHMNVGEARGLQVLLGYRNKTFKRNPEK